MTPQEEFDLNKMKKEIIETDKSTLEMCETFLRYTLEDLSNCGYHTKEEAILKTLESGLKKKQKLMAAHTKKYPD